MTETVNQSTGEIIADEASPNDLPTPLTFEQANAQINHLNQWLGRNSNERVELLKKLEPVQSLYTAVYNATLLSSERTEATLRKAEALIAVENTPAPDDPEVSLAKRLATLKMQLKVATDRGHDVRSVLSSLQTVSKNLQSEASFGGRQI